MSQAILEWTESTGDSYQRCSDDSYQRYYISYRPHVVMPNNYTRRVRNVASLSAEADPETFRKSEKPVHTQQPRRASRADHPRISQHPPQNSGVPQG
jgi:hypothetical protein